jgi:triphosphoribosyl-dephospho-CoA synthase
MVQATLDFASMPLRTGLTHVLDATTPADAAAVYAAIRLASPGGLGKAGQQDVADEPDVTLVEAMRLAAERGLIARQYANGFDELCNVAVPYFDDALARLDHGALAMTDLYLYLLARFPDSHVARKHGVACAVAVCERAGHIHADFLAASDQAARLGVLRHYDAELKQRGINPGTTADLCVAACFFHRLQQQAETHAGSAPDHARTSRPKRGFGPHRSISQEI